MQKSLFDFVYRSAHTRVLAKQRDYFQGLLPVRHPGMIARAAIPR
jgi:hypothetical protein